VDRPRVTRSIEVIVQPVLPFRSAILTQGRIDVGNSQTIADSFDSSDPQKSTSGEYDSARRQNNGSVFTNEADFTFGGTIYGAAGTNGGTLASSPRITGPVTNSSLKPLPPIPAPNWTSIAPGPTTITAPTTIAAVTSSAPTRYKFSTIGSDLTISGAAGSTVEVWVTGDISGKVIVEPGVRASIYVGGNIRLSSSTLENRNRRAADLQIYGIDPPAGETRAMDFDISREIHAAVYAPAHVIQLTGNGHFTGSITGRSLKTSGRAQFHYDEMLSLRTGPVLSYTVASWIEDVR
jgi:cytoskeletal protein CcmA (bactofilin family)